MAEFSTTLTADASPADEIFYVASNEGARTTYPWRATIDNEVVYVTRGVVAGEVLPVVEAGIVSDGLIWSVRRGADDTDAADHVAGTVLRGVRLRGAVQVAESLTEDDSSPVAALTDDSETDFLTSDAVEGV